MSIAFVYFDLGKVILEFSHQKACQQMAELANVEPEVVNDLLFGEAGLQQQYESGLVSSSGFHARFCEATGSNPDPRQLALAASDIFELNTEMVPLIVALYRTGIPLGILSNTCEAHWQLVLTRYKIIGELFRTHVLSFEIQSMKPDSAIYRAAIRQAAEEMQASLQAGDVFFMDDRSENVAGAIREGIDAVLFENAAQLADDLRERGLEFDF